jgi:hypothetical protein
MALVDVMTFISDLIVISLVIDVSSCYQPHSYSHFVR